MEIVICGAGQVGGYAAEALAGLGHNVTVIDTDASRLRRIEETLDVRTLCGSAAGAEVAARVTRVATAPQIRFIPPHRIIASSRFTPAAGLKG